MYPNTTWNGLLPTQIDARNTTSDDLVFVAGEVSALEVEVNGLYTRISTVHGEVTDLLKTVIACMATQRKGEPGENGRDGERGLTGIQGEKGLTGEPGATGSEGRRGVQGLMGLTGRTGATGPTGPEGKIGPTGVQGLQGLPGRDGKEGPRGFVGPDGKSVEVSLWKQGRTYLPNQLVSYQGSLYQTPETTDSRPIDPPWICVVRAGLNGSVGQQGSTGVDGVDGATGPAGATGPGYADNLTIEYTGSLFHPTPVTVFSRYSYIETSGEQTTLTGKGIAVLSLPAALTHEGDLLTYSMPDLDFIGQTLSVTGHTALTSLRFPQLKFSGAITCTGCNALATVDFGSLVVVSGAFNLTPGNQTTLSSFDMHSITYIAGALTLAYLNSTIRSLDLSELEAVSGAMTLNTATGIETLRLDNLEWVNGAVAITSIGSAGHTCDVTVTSLARVTSLTMSSVATSDLNFAALTVSGVIAISGATGTTCSTLSFPVLTNPTSFTLSAFTSLTTLSMPSMITCGLISVTTSSSLATVTQLGAIGTTKAVTGNVTISQAALTSASVDYILGLLFSLDGSNGTTLYGSGRTVNLSGGTSATPTHTGLTASYNCSEFTGSGTTITVNHTAHGFQTGDILTISGVVPNPLISGANGTWSINRVNDDRFTYTTTLTVGGQGTAGQFATVKKAGSLTEGFYYKQKLIMRGATVSTN